MKVNKVHMDTLNRLIELKEKTGEIFWKVKAGNKIIPGSKAGTMTKRGYLRVVVGGVRLSGHRVVWALHNGDWPPDDMEIDHINGDRVDNRPCNLRLCSPSQNRANAACYKGNSGVRGVSWCKNVMKWHVRVMKNKKNILVGYFDCKQEAHQAYCKAAEEVHGEYSYVLSRSKP